MRWVVAAALALLPIPYWPELGLWLYTPCDLGHYRLNRPHACPYCTAQWEITESMTFGSGEAGVQLHCSCDCDAIWYPARGQTASSDVALDARRSTGGGRRRIRALLVTELSGGSR